MMLMCKIRIGIARCKVRILCRIGLDCAGLGLELGVRLGYCAGLDWIVQNWNYLKVTVINR